MGATSFPAFDPAMSDRGSSAKPLAKVLVLSRNYPNCVLQTLGLWVAGLVRHSLQFCEPKVIAPVPWCPPGPFPEEYKRFRRVPLHGWDNGVEVFHPRFLVGPGYALHSLEAFTYELGIRRRVDRLQRFFPFDLIHAHFTFPDGVVAVRLGQRYRVPVIVTEQNPWGPWLEKQRSVRRQAIWAARQCRFHLAISTAVRDSIVHYRGESENLRIIPDGVHGDLFRLAPERAIIPNQLVFVGAVRKVKGVDVLLQAMHLLRAEGRELRLLLIGEPYYRSYRQDYDRVVQLAHELKLDPQVDFLGKQPLSELVRHLQQSALLVLPSRAESFGMVLLEALACGTPVVATRCGGPEDIVTPEVGVLVPPEDPQALARGIAHVLDKRGSYDPVKLRAYCLENFGLPRVGRRLAALYQEALQDFHQDA